MKGDPQRFRNKKEYITNNHQLNMGSEKGGNRIDEENKGTREVVTETETKFDEDNKYATKGVVLDALDASERVRGKEKNR